VSIPDQGVYISSAQTYAEVLKLIRKVDLLDSKLDQILEETREIKGDLSAQEARIRSIELGETERQRRDAARLNSLEARRWPLPAVGALSGLAGAVTGAVALFVR
jgi:hypothetical protein